MNEMLILSAIGSTEESSFFDFVSALGSEKPDKGDRDAWRQLFMQIEKLEVDGFVEVCRTGRSIDSLILTEAGAARVRASR